MRPLLAALLFLITPIAAASIQVDPIDPTNRSFVILSLREVWPERCLPRSPVIERNGSSIDILWQYDGCVCPGKIDWEEDIEVGMLPAGRYDITARVRYTTATAPQTVTVATRTLAVREHNPALVVTPRLIATNETTSVRIARDGNLLCADDVTASANGVPLRRVGCAWEMEPHAAGSVDIRVRANGTEYESIGAVQYVDPRAAPDPLLYERMLVPVLLNADGAFGSVWETRVTMDNLAAADLRWLPEVSRPICTEDSCPPGLPGESSTSLRIFGEHADGLVLFVPRTLASSVRFTGLVSNARDRSQYGVQLPVVRERDLRSGTFLVGEVPFDRRYRVQLRVYGVDGASLPVSVGVADGGYWAEHPIDVKAPCTTAELPCNSSAPAFGSIDVGATFPWLVDGKRYRVYVRPRTDRHPLRYWGFVSITDNATQHVTLITPQ